MSRKPAATRPAKRKPADPLDKLLTEAARRASPRVRRWLQRLAAAEQADSVDSGVSTHEQHELK